MRLKLAGPAFQGSVRLCASGVHGAAPKLLAPASARPAA